MKSHFLSCMDYGFNEKLNVLSLSVTYLLSSSKKNLWNSVKIAKDKAVEPIPHKLYKDHLPIREDSRCEEFAMFFDAKV